MHHVSGQETRASNSQRAEFSPARAPAPGHAPQWETSQAFDALVSASSSPRCTAGLKDGGGR